MPEQQRFEARTLATAAAAVAVTALAPAVGWHPLAGAAGGLAIAAMLTRLVWPRLMQATPPPPPRPSPAPTGFRLDGVAADLLAGLPLGLVLLDAQGRVLLANPAAEDMLERRLLGMMGPAVMRAPALAEAIGAALTLGRHASLDVTLLRSAERVIHATVGPVRASGGALEGGPRVVILLEDRTRAARAEALRRDFVANASHELRTPLASISGFVETLQAHGRDDPEAAARFLPIMAAQAERMRRLIDDLLSLNRIESNEHMQPRERIDLLDTVRDTAAALMPVAQAAGVTLRVDLPPEAMPVRGDPGELAQVFANLIDNAIKYGRSGGAVTVCREAGRAPRPGLCGVSVVDDGPGIAREHLPRLTERFYRVSAERSRAQGGTGLGLAIAKHVLNRHRGDLAIASTPGEGSRFTVWLPAAADAVRDAGQAA